MSGAGPRWCLTGAEPTLPQLEARLRADRSDVMHEIRLDALASPDDAAFGLLAAARAGGRTLVCTCRGRAGGGTFRGTERERAVVLRRALAVSPAWLDVELETPVELRQELWAARGTTGLLLSAHDLGQPSAAPAARIAALTAALAREPADALKLAVSLTDAADLSPLRAALASEPRPVVRIGMGDAGLLSRALPERFGSPWTYVVAEAAPPTAPGQLSLAQALAWRLGDAAKLHPFGLLGGRQVMQSPGPAVYNRLFAARALPWLYLPVVTERPADALALVSELGFAALAVTMPAKQAVAALADRLVGPAAALEAVNTLVLGPHGRIGHCTDADAVAELLQPQAPRRALILGRGGAARAAGYALTLLGSEVTLAARLELPAGGRAHMPGARLTAWESRGRVDFDTLVNATPLGSDGWSDPLPEHEDWQGRVVLDMVVASGDTPLVRRARAGGALVLSGLEMWLRQAVRQLRIVTGATVELDELRSLAQEPSAAAWRTSP